MPQALPLDPQADPDWAAWRTQVVPSQHPPTQEEGVQAQTPAVPHACPEAHPPQAAPLVPHWPAVCAA